MQGTELCLFCQEFLCNYFETMIKTSVLVPFMYGMLWHVYDQHNIVLYHRTYHRIYHRTYHTTIVQYSTSCIYSLICPLISWLDGWKIDWLKCIIVETVQCSA